MRTLKYQWYLQQLQGHPSALTTNHDGSVFLKIVSDNFNKKDKLLILGAAEGREVCNLKENGFVDITGITLGKSNLEKCKKEFPNCDLRLMDMCDLQFPVESFDGVIGVHVYEHSFSPWIQMLEVWSVLKPNGKVIFSMPLNWSDMDDRIMQIRETNYLSSHHPNLMTIGIHCDIFEACGFDILHYPVKSDFLENNKYFFESFWILQKDSNLKNVHSDVRSCLEKRLEIKDHQWS